MSANNVMASIFWDEEGVLLVHYLDKGHTSPERIMLREIIKQIRRRKLTSRVLFHQDNAPAYTSRLVIAAIQKCGFQHVEYQIYSPDLAPSDYYLFRKWTKELGGHKLSRDDDVMNALDHFPKDQNGAFYTEEIRLIHGCWTKYVNVGSLLKTWQLFIY